MATMISEVYDALRDAGASEEKARKAAEVLANHESWFDKIKGDIAAFRVEVRGKLSLVKWMLGFVLAFVVALTFKAFS